MDGSMSPRTSRKHAAPADNRDESPAIARINGDGIERAVLLKYRAFADEVAEQDPKKDKDGNLSASHSTATMLYNLYTEPYAQHGVSTYRLTEKTAYEPLLATMRRA